MSTNPNPTYVTDEEWRLYEAEIAAVPGAQGSGIYANKPGYHNTVTANKPSDYSVQLPLDKQHPPKDKARALDITMSDAQMRLRTGYLWASAKHPEDDRLMPLREFIGTTDSQRVCCLIQSGSGDWVEDWGRDSSHFWHVHKSVFTAYCDVWDAAPGVPGLEGVLSVWVGESWESWKARKGGSGMPKIIRIDEPVEDITAKALYATGGGGFYWLSDAVAYANFWGLPDPFGPNGYHVFPTRAAAEVGGCGPYLGKYNQLATGPKGDKGDKGEPGDDGEGFAPGQIVTMTGTVTVQ